MIRLRDRIMSEHMYNPGSIGGARIPAQDLRERIKSLPIIVIDNVAEYLHAGTDQEEWDFTKDFPCLTLPFEHCWMEAKRPSKTVSEMQPGTVLSASHLPECTGVVLSMAPIPDVARLVLERKWALGPGAQMLTAMMFWRINGRVEQLPMTYSIFITAEGVGVGTPIFGVLDASLPRGGEVTKALQAIINATMLPYLLAISFMHCKNIAQREDGPTPEQSKAHQRRKGEPLTRYTVLDIDPMREVLQTEGGASTNGLVKALHICRGHFKNYGEKGLFGRLKGRFWWPSTVRGKATAGVVEKTYNVKAGKEP